MPHIKPFIADGAFATPSLVVPEIDRKLPEASFEEQNGFFGAMRQEIPKVNCLPV
ncbi:MULTISPECIES: hypothetical protein [Sinorhizobium]|uniref:Uncharacterized protein n=1 Tax=Sinorhizobium psoraleae TaxID=520838 RepID=A0ABT4KFI1_9HYPH|nr:MULTISPECIES: hypothetical protein [Sinorhizobium]MCZ4090106.1 hypothetical protein [Sinorhizobium psoraleae]MDK1384548.1 hypothetical protein [Sinorhizobium sp. 7-81]